MNASASIEDYLATVRQALTDLPKAEIQRLVDLILSARAADRQIFLFGNGGSAATASHFACDLGKGTIQPGKRRLRVISLCDQIPMMTAWANDADYSDIFVEQLSNLLNEDDLVIGISSSGNSPNVLKALQYAKDQGATTVALTGFRGGQVKEIVDECLIVPSTSVQIIEDIHLILGHIIFLQICSKIRMERSESLNEPNAR
jgi:D-sedoheptulose 7-phosphate isomerase